MTTKTEIHPIQADILKVFLFQPEARFSDLNISHLPTDHFTFHIKKLVEVGLIEKSDGGFYGLTATGKEFANRFDVETDRVILERQAKAGVLVGCVRGVDSTRQYLIQQRLKQPYFGFYGFLTGKIKWGETILETSARELLEETGLCGDLKLVGIKHKMDYGTEGNLLEDKFFYVFRAENTRGDLLESFDGGRNVWLSKKDALALPEVFDGVDETIRWLDQDELQFVESKYTVARY